MRCTLLLPMCVGALFVNVFVAGSAQALTRNWVPGDGNWSVAGNWSPSGVPTAGDTVSIGFGDGLDRTVTYNYTGAAVTLNSVGLDQTGGTGSSTLAVSTNNLTSTFEYVGYNGHGTVNQTGGTNTIAAGAGYLDVGTNFGSTGTYNLSGSGAVSANSNEYIGDGGDGFFIHTAGTNVINGGKNVYIGYQVGST